jgi:hypothetical protein
MKASIKGSIAEVNLMENSDLYQQTLSAFSAENAARSCP